MDAGLHVQRIVVPICRIPIIEHVLFRFFGYNFAAALGSNFRPSHATVSDEVSESAATLVSNNYSLKTPCVETLELPTCTLHATILNTIVVTGLH